ALIQVVSSRMSLPPHDPSMADDPNYRVQRQMAYVVPFISLIYGSILPAGMFLYWITSTIYRLVQTFLFMGCGRLFPLFGSTPAASRPPCRPPSPGRAGRPPRHSAGPRDERPGPTRRFATRNAAEQAAEGDAADECVPRVHRQERGRGAQGRP